MKRSEGEFPFGFTGFLPRSCWNGWLTLPGFGLRRILQKHALSGQEKNKTCRRFLLAEDDNDMRRFLSRALQNAGYDVVSFDNGKSAYDRLREEPFNLLLTDIVMPEMDGIELARRATELDPDLKVMFITGFAAVALNPDSNTPKDAKVLSKPFPFARSGK